MKKIYFFVLAIVFALSVKSQDTIAIWHVIDFDTSSNYIQIDTSSQNLWQVGTPQKVIFNSAFQSEKAILTDTINNYAQGNHSWFDISVGDFIYPMYFPYSVFIGFDHKFDTDTLYDGCYIEVSYDMGQSWTNIISDSTYSNSSTIYNSDVFNHSNYLYSQPDTLFNGEYGFSGNSQGWTHTTIVWYMPAAKNYFPSEDDTLIIRFNFISDSTGIGREGWMIDNLTLYSIDVGGGFAELQQKGFIENVFPNPFSHKLSLDLKEGTGAFEVTISNIEGKPIFFARYPSNKTTIINIPEITQGNYFITVATDNGLSETRSIVVE